MLKSRCCMQVLDYRGHTGQLPRTRLLEAAVFMAASRYGPALEGCARGFVARHMLEEGRPAEIGFHALLSSSIKRLEQDSIGRGGNSYTKQHSFEVARFVYIMAREAQLHGLAGANGPDPALAFAGGLIHDIGKTFLPTAIVEKELGVRFAGIAAFRDRRLTDDERRVLRKEHVSAGTDYVRLFGAGEHIKIMLDMVGLHHVMYNGKDTCVPSYPSLLSGKNLPFHARIAKTADFVSAVLPRHYSATTAVLSLDGAVAYSVSVAGMELDPTSVQCLMCGMYDIDPPEAKKMIERLSHPDGQEGISDMHGARKYAKKAVMTDPDFAAMIKRRSARKLGLYNAEMKQCMQEYGLSSPDGIANQ